MTRKSKEKKTAVQLVKGLANYEIQDIWRKDWQQRLFAPIDISTIVFFRIMFGLILFIEMMRFFRYDWIARYWIEPLYNFPYWPFDFMRPLAGDGMYYLFGFLALCSLGILFGAFYRISMIGFFLGFSYTVLIEQTRYLNHFYLVMLVSFLMIFIPANRSFAWDARKKRSEVCPAWCLWLLRFMIGVPYFFGGIAKISPDWLQGQPMKLWLGERTGFPVIGSLFREHWMVLFMSYSGLLLDLLIVPALLFRKTRIWGILFITSFHLLNSQLFSIGIFPWFMIAATLLFFPPDWPRRLYNSVSKSGNAWPITLSTPEQLAPPEVLNRQQRLTLIGLSIWVTIQVFLPFRHWLYPGDVNWTEEGHRYSWHMKLRDKQTRGYYRVVDKATGVEEKVQLTDYLPWYQAAKLEYRPNLIWRFCQLLKREYAKKGRDVAVYAEIEATLNGRKYQKYIDPTIDMTTTPRPVFRSSSWIMPLVIPLEDQRSDINGYHDQE